MTGSYRLAEPSDVVDLDPEAMLDIIAISSFRQKYKAFNGDESFALSEQDEFERFAANFQIDDSIARCFQGVPKEPEPKLQSKEKPLLNHGPPFNTHKITVDLHHGTESVATGSKTTGSTHVQCNEVNRLPDYDGQLKKITPISNTDSTEVGRGSTNCGRISSQRNRVIVTKERSQSKTEMDYREASLPTKGSQMDVENILTEICEEMARKLEVALRVSYEAKCCAVTPKALREGLSDIRGSISKVGSLFQSLEAILERITLEFDSLRKSAGDKRNKRQTKKRLQNLEDCTDDIINASLPKIKAHLGDVNALVCMLDTDGTGDTVTYPRIDNDERSNIVRQTAALYKQQFQKIFIASEACHENTIPRHLPHKLQPETVSPVSLNDQSISGSEVGLRIGTANSKRNTRIYPSLEKIVLVPVLNEQTSQAGKQNNQAEQCPIPKPRTKFLSTEQRVKESENLRQARLEHFFRRNTSTGSTALPGKFIEVITTPSGQMLTDYQIRGKTMPIKSSQQPTNLAQLFAYSSSACESEYGDSKTHSSKITYSDLLFHEPEPESDERCLESEKWRQDDYECDVNLDHFVKPISYSRKLDDRICDSPEGDTRTLAQSGSSPQDCEDGSDRVLSKKLWYEISDDDDDQPLIYQKNRSIHR